MPYLPAKPATDALELKLLRVLCTRHEAADPTAKLRASLKTYAWNDPEHRIVFEALCRLAGSLTSLQLREQLPAQATRMGFPDVNWQNYFQAGEIENADIEDLVRRLLETTQF